MIYACASSFLVLWLSMCVDDLSKKGNNKVKVAVAMLVQPYLLLLCESYSILLNSFHDLVKR